MSTLFPHLLLPGDDSRLDEVSTSLSKLNDICELYTISDDKRELLSGLHAGFWQTLVGFTPLCISSDNVEEFVIPDYFKKWLVYGYISKTICPLGESIIDEQQKVLNDVQRQTSTEYVIMYVDEWIQSVYQKIIKKEYKEQCLKKLVLEKRKLANYPASLESSRERRAEFLKQYPEAQDAVEVSCCIERLLPEYGEIKDKIDHSQLITQEERSRFVDLKNEIDRLRELRKKRCRMVSDLIPVDDLTKLDVFVENTLAKKGELERNVLAAQARVEEDATWRKSMSASVCREMLREEMRRLRVMIELAARRSRIKPNSVLAETDSLVTPWVIIEAIEEILDVDPTLAQKTRKKGKSFPRILCVPVMGDGLFDFENNLLIVPLQAPRSIVQSVATALIEYHLDTDEDNELRNNYLKLKKNSGVHSTIQLRERLVRDYVAWVTLEAKGRQVLDKETKEWFITYIAPPTFALKHSRRLGDFSSFDAPGLITLYEKQLADNPRDFDTAFRLGIVAWRIEEYQKSSNAFLTAARLAPQDRDACYNAAISCYKVNDLQGAVHYWQEYLRIDKASFWMLRVQNFLREVRSQ